MYYTRALIGQYPCLDQSIQTRKFPAKSIFLKLNYCQYCGYFIKEIPNGFLYLDTQQHRNIPRVWIRVSKHGKPLGISLINDDNDNIEDNIF